MLGVMVPPLGGHNKCSIPLQPAGMRGQGTLGCTHRGFRPAFCEEMSSPSGGDQVIPGGRSVVGAIFFRAVLISPFPPYRRELLMDKTTTNTPAQNPPTASDWVQAP